MKSLATRAAIGEAAAHEFLAAGYAGASMSAIADRMGLTKGALGYHFPAKSDFLDYFAVATYMATEKAASLAYEKYPATSVHRLLYFILQMRAWYFSYPEVAGGIALNYDTAAPQSQIANYWVLWRQRVQDGFVACFDDGSARGPLTAVDATELTLASVAGSALIARRNPDDEDLGMGLRSILNVFRAVGIQGLDEIFADVSGNLSSAGLSFQEIGRVKV